MPDPIVEFYIQNYMWNGSLVTSRTLFQTIPLASDPVIKDPKVKCEMGKSGSFEFSMEMTSPYYDALLQLKTIFRIVYFGNTIFRGRVLTIDKSMGRTRSVHCEGDFSFLLDSHQPGTKEDNRKEITVLQYLQSIITQHNSDMSGNNEKKFALGEVPGQYTNATPSACRVTIPSAKAKQKFGDTSWNTSMDRIEGLLSNFGGYFRTRYDTTNPNSPVVYLDWLDNYYNSSINTQTIEITKNLIDISGPTEVENLFTVLIPIGKKDSNSIYIDKYWPIAQSGHAKVNYITVPELVTAHLYSDAELNSGYHRKSDYENAITHFGKIWRTETFDNANTPEKLFNYAKDWIKNNFMPEITQWSVSALDMKIIDPTKQVILCGDRVDIIHPEVDRTYSGLTVISAEYNLYDPDKNSYTIGIPNQQINAAYGVKAKSKKGGGVSSPKSEKPEPENDAEKDIEALKRSAQTQYSIKSDFKFDIGLDDPYAFMMYDEYGQELSEKDAASKAAQFQKALQQLYSDPQLMNSLRYAASLRGVPEDDPQLLVDFAPGMKYQQTTWKNNTTDKFKNELELTDQEINVLLNDSVSSSWLAGLVTDDGEWSQRAIDQGYPDRENAAKIKEMAVNTRSILSGKSNTTGASILSSMQSVFVGGDINIGDYITSNLGIDLKDFNIGDIFNTNELTNEVTGLSDKGLNFLDGLFEGDLSGLGLKEFNLESVSTLINGLVDGGNAGFGTEGLLDGFKVTINQPFTYTATDPSGQQRLFTVSSGEVAADDFHFTAKYDSLYAKLLVVDNLIAARATINQLNAAVARIQTLEADSITTSNLESHIADIDVMVTKYIAATGNISASANMIATDFLLSSGSGATTSMKNSMRDVYIKDNQDGTYTLQKKDWNNGSEWTDVVTFSKAGSATTLSGSWSGKTYTVTASPQGNTISVSPDAYFEAQQGQPTYRARVYLGTPSSSSTTGYDPHGDPKVAYLVANGLTVSLKSENSTSSGNVYAATTLSDSNLVAGNIKSGVSIFGVSGSYSGGTTLSGAWSSNTYTVTASPQGNTNSVSPEAYYVAQQGQPTYTASIVLGTPSSSASTGYTSHGSTKSAYLVANGLTVSLRSANSTSSGQVYASRTLSDSNLVAGNIKSGVSIFGVSGSYSTDSAKNEVKINPFTANAVSTLTNYRTFTYTTDAPNPASGTSRSETWYVVNAGVTTGTDYAQPGTLKAELRYGSATGTTYARRNFTINHVELWSGDGSAQVTSKTITSKTTFRPWCKIEGSWVKGSEVTITPGASISVVDSGQGEASYVDGTILKGSTVHTMSTSMGAKQSGWYRYIIFNVNGSRHAFKFA